MKEIFLLTFENDLHTSWSKINIKIDNNKYYSTKGKDSKKIYFLLLKNVYDSATDVSN